MNSPTLVFPDSATQNARKPNYLGLRACCWTVALALGATQAWVTRFTMNPDGISYLDIGDAYWRHDWHNAINAYWSPLYSWILGFFINVIKPSPHWEYPLVHLVNFLIYVAALACFEYFLTTWTDILSRSGQETTLPNFFWRILGATIFILASLVLNGLSLATPDIAVSGCVYLAAALLLRIASELPKASTYAILGVVLGFAYLAKAAMLPVGLVFLITAFLAGGRSILSLKRSALATAVFCIVAIPFIIALSWTHKRIMFSAVGPIAYEVYVDHVNQFIPTGSDLQHPVHRVLDSPETYEYAEPFHATYPLWFASDYWHQGIKPYFLASGEKGMVLYGLALYLYILCIPHSVMLVALLVLLLIAPNVQRGAHVVVWPQVTPCLFALIMYLVVYTESRYVAPFVCLLWFAAFSRVRVKRTPLWNRALTAVGILFLGSAMYFVRAATLHAGSAAKGMPIYSQAAEKLYALGIHPEDKLATVAAEPYAGGGAFVARLLRARIVAESSAQDLHWLVNGQKCAAFEAAVRNLEVRAILFYGEPPSNSALHWTPLAGTGYYVSLVR